MRRFESVWEVKMHSRGFTLIEVMVAVVIITVVIGSMLQLFSNNTRFFTTMESKMDIAYQSSLLIGSSDVGFESKRLTLDELVKEFKVDDDLRRSLKTVEVNIGYSELMRLDEADLESQAEEMGLAEEEPEATEQAAATALEIGRTSIRHGDMATSFVRLKLQ